MEKMKKLALLFASAVLAVLLAGGVALAATIDCPNRGGNLCVGTNDRDVMYGTDIADELRGRGGPDSIAGDAGNDKLYGGDGQDFFQGGKGNDTLVGGLAYDDLRGGTGDDRFDAGPGDASYHFLDSWGRDIIEGTGPDGGRGYLHFHNNRSTSTGVTVHLEPSAERNEAFSGANTLNFTRAAKIWRVHGTYQADVILGSHRRDYLEGYPGADDLAGLGGDDRLDGGLGRDTFRAGEGSDTIHAIDDKADKINCGNGIDTVHYDRRLDTFGNGSTSPPPSCETTLTT
jgi:Ca2+-binding RTX toxin-like protein